ncbi:Rv1733c family protein, partial [Actinacidiphila rubida]
TRQAPPAPAGYSLTGSTGAVRSDVHWTTADGRVHHGLAIVRPDSPAGSRTTVWLDRGGALHDDPVDPVAVRGRAMAYGTCAATGTALLAGAGWTCTRRCLDRRRAADLDREWARVGPQWGTTARG